MKTRPLLLTLGMAAFTAMATPSALADSAVQKANKAYYTAIAHETNGNAADAKSPTNRRSSSTPNTPTPATDSASSRSTMPRSRPREQNAKSPRS